VRNISRYLRNEIERVIASGGIDEFLLCPVTGWTCSLNIALLSVPGLIAMPGAVRGLAPTRLRLTGATAGLLAGAVGTLAYSLRCPETSVPFWATWYLIGMAVPAIAGAVLGGRALRW
jgi:hypothetical protein